MLRLYVEEDRRTAQLQLHSYCWLFRRGWRMFPAGSAKPWTAVTSSRRLTIARCWTSGSKIGITSLTLRCIPSSARKRRQTKSARVCERMRASLSLHQKEIIQCEQD